MLAEQLTEEFYILGYNAVQSGESQPTFRRNKLPLFSGWDGGDMFLWKVYWRLSDYTALHSRRHNFSQPQLRTLNLPRWLALSKLLTSSDYNNHHLKDGLNYPVTDLHWISHKLLLRCFEVTKQISRLHKEMQHITIFWLLLPSEPLSTALIYTWMQWMLAGAATVKSV
jgi:hypothetical protein